jgi:hypothetical protein
MQDYGHSLLPGSTHAVLLLKRARGARSMCFLLRYGLLTEPMLA